MPNICEQKLCRNTRRISNLTFFKFPKSEELFNMWATNCFRLDLIIGPRLSSTSYWPKKNYYLCEDHFRSCDIKYLNTGRKVLIKGAIPCKRIIVKGFKSKSVSSCHLEIILNPLSLSDDIGPQKNIKFEISEMKIFHEIRNLENQNSTLCNRSVSKNQDQCKTIENNQTKSKNTTNENNVGKSISHIAIDEFPEEEVLIRLPHENSHNIPPAVIKKKKDIPLTNLNGFKLVPIQNGFNLLPPGMNKISEVQTPSFKPPEIYESASSVIKKKDSNKSSCSDSSVCPHYISFIEEKAKSHKQKRETEKLIRKMTTLETLNEEIEKENTLLKERLKILENLKIEPEEREANEVCRITEYESLVGEIKEEEAENKNGLLDNVSFSL